MLIAVWCLILEVHVWYPPLINSNPILLIKSGHYPDPNISCRSLDWIPAYLKIGWIAHIVIHQVIFRICLEINLKANFTLAILLLLRNNTNSKNSNLYYLEKWPIWDVSVFDWACVIILSLRFHSQDVTFIYSWTHVWLIKRRITFGSQMLMPVGWLSTFGNVRRPRLYKSFQHNNNNLISLKQVNLSVEWNEVANWIYPIHMTNSPLST